MRAVSRGRCEETGRAGSSRPAALQQGRFRDPGQSQRPLLQSGGVIRVIANPTNFPRDRKPCEAPCPGRPKLAIGPDWIEKDAVAFRASADAFTGKPCTVHIYIHRHVCMYDVGTSIHISIHAHLIVYGRGCGKADVVTAVVVVVVQAAERGGGVVLVVGW